jgi:5-methylthioadenosine/S-adenosylhomocysteine deaminase
VREIDLTIRTGAMLPLTGPEVVDDALIAVDGGRIVYAGPAGDAPEVAPRSVIEDRRAVALPGFVDTHTHVGAHLFGTVCDEENVITALYELWFPMEGALDPDVIHAGSCLGLWDALRGGVTTVANDEFFPEATAEAALRVGARAMIGNRIIGYSKDHPPVYDRSSRSYELSYDPAEFQRGLQENVDFVERWRGSDTVVPCLGPHTPDTLSTDMLLECARAAEALDVKMLVHIAQSQAELAQVARKGHRGSIRYLQEIGFLSPRVQGAHMVWLDDEEIGIAAASGMGASWTPTIMMACHSFARIDQLMASGMGLGFGTDCFSMDVIEELRYATYGANFVRGETGFQLGAYDLVRLATIGGARCLGLDAEIGTLEAGKRADVVVLNLDDAQLVPNTNHFETIVYRAKSRDVTHTIVDGRVVCEHGRLTLADQDELLAEGRKAARTWLGRCGDLFERTGVAGRIESRFHARGPSGGGPLVAAAPPVADGRDIDHSTSIS